MSAPEPALRPVNLTVVGSINVDYTLQVERLPRPGETVAAHHFLRAPGGKGANQAVAAARLGAKVTMVGAVGDDMLAEEALVGLRAAGVKLELERTGETGLAMIYVDASGENEIAVFPGANGALTPREVGGFVLCQLEVPDEVVRLAAKSARFFVLNASPARELDVEPNLLIVNALEYETFSRGKLVAVTYGAEGAALVKDGEEIARAQAPTIEARDGTGAGDAFAAALTYTLLAGVPPENALRFACTAGAWVAAQMGAQLSMPTMEDVFLWM